MDYRSRHIKLIHLLKEIISEVGEGSANPYSYNVNDNVFRGSSKNVAGRDITFTTEDGDDYIVSFAAYYGNHSNAEERGPYFKVDFTTVDEYGYEDRADRVVNKGRLFRIMSTVVKATKEFLNDIDYKEKNIGKMLIFPAKSDFGDDRRANLYTAYIKKQLPVSDVAYDGKVMVATLK
tara:strand:+ start:901 stop:1434 length:534 start_codon:yes stop_codon:yes gene_type:complete